MKDNFHYLSQNSAVPEARSRRGKATVGQAVDGGARGEGQVAEQNQPAGERDQGPESDDRTED